ncbi:MAG: hypothetical protein J3K34DRAFT_447021 [Monoraphidium minutum]|nr:MAG: hypothetical protein J3K34DRAFT_447021 [Monoraphidium minutum]
MGASAGTDTANAGSNSGSSSSSSSDDDDAQAVLGGAASQGDADNSSGTRHSSAGSSETSWQERLWEEIADAAAQQPGAAASGPVDAADGAPLAALDMAALQERFRRDMQAVPITAAPYPGARRLLRWEQQLFFHAAATTEPHPRERKVVLRVHARELAAEVGLTPAGVKHMLHVAGTKGQGGRYDPVSGDIKLACDRFPTREENRRWCLGALHRLVAEADRAHPSPEFLFAADSRRRGGGYNSPFLSQGSS